MENSTMKTGNPVANEEDFQKVANKVSTITIIGNIALSLLKLFAGIVAHSNAMISDAIHSASDVFSTFVVIIGIRLASKKPDKEHPYGHERLECVAAIVLAIVLLITGLGIGIEAFKTILQGNSDNIQTPGILALIAAIISKSSVASSAMTSRMSSMVIMPTILFSPSTTGSEIRSYFLIVWDASS